MPNSQCCWHPYGLNILLESLCWWLSWWACRQYYGVHYSYYLSLLLSVHKIINNAFWTMSNLPFNFKVKKVLPTTAPGTGFKQNIFETSTSIAHSAIKQTVPYILNQVVRCWQTISGMITERHDTACRLIMKPIKAGSLGVCLPKWITARKTAWHHKTNRSPEVSPRMQFQIYAALWPGGWLSRLAEYLILLSVQL